MVGNGLAMLGNFDNLSLHHAPLQLLVGEFQTVAGVRFPNAIPLLLLFDVGYPYGGLNDEPAMPTVRVDLGQS